MANLYNLIEHAARMHPRSIAFERQDGATFTYDEMLAAVEQFAASLGRFGVGVGDRITVQVEKSIESVWLYLATLRVGAVYVPLNTAYTLAELRYFIDDACPSLIVVEADRTEQLARDVGVNARVATLRQLACSTFDASAACVERTDDDLAAIIYTSGTTGRSKGAMLSHGNLTSNATTLIQLWGFAHSDVLVHALPIYHVHGLFVALHCALVSGARIRFLSRFDASETIAALRGATVFMGVPTYYTRLLASVDFQGEATQLRLWISGSAPLLPETFAAFEARTGQRILERYGMSEAGMITSNPLVGVRRAGTVGKTLPGVTARVRAADGSVAAVNQPGVLEIKGANVFSGYWGNEEKTRESFTDDGFFITGDIVSRDAEGIISIVGREKDLIISGGLNVYPREIEAEIDELPGVRESAVIGVPHADFGEAVVAVIDADATDDLETRLIAALRDRLAGFKIPKRIFCVDALPRNAMGKVQKNVLRNQYSELFK